MLRLRQIVYVASDLEASISELGEALGAGVVFRDPGVAEFGLHNALFCVGDQFVEIVSPTTGGTAAGRLLDKRSGDGGYMVMLQTDDLAGLEPGFETEGIRVILDARTSGSNGSAIRGLHLHPKDIGSAILSIDEADPVDSWLWAGEDWAVEPAATDVSAVTGVVIQSGDPQATGARWAAALGVDSRATANGSAIDLDDATLEFVPLRDDRGDGIVGYLFSGIGSESTSSSMVIGAEFVRT